MGIGLVRLIAGHKDIIGRHNFAHEYLSKFNQFAESYQKSFDVDLYVWLMSKVDKIQTQTAFCGLVDYRPPFANYYLKNYQIILNTIPKMHTRDANVHDISMCQDALIRYTGILSDRVCLSISRIKNPFTWLQEGVSFLLIIPMLVLQWTGLLNPSRVDAVILSPVFRIFSGIVMLLGLIASILTIILGWHDFIRIF